MIVKDVKVGKIDKKVVKALFKVIIDDTQNEILCRSDYLTYVDKQLHRLHKADGYYQKFLKAHTDAKKDYYRQGVEMYLDLAAHESVENFKAVEEEYRQSLKDRKEHIKKLYSEIHQIKKLTL